MMISLDFWAIPLLIAAALVFWMVVTVAEWGVRRMHEGQIARVGIRLGHMPE